MTLYDSGEKITEEMMAQFEKEIGQRFLFFIIVHPSLHLQDTGASPDLPMCKSDKLYQVRSNPAKSGENQPNGIKAIDTGKPRKTLIFRGL